MTTPPKTPADPQNPKSKPHGTTRDQINEMESEGQARTAGQPAPGDHSRATVPDEVPGDTRAADIVGPTGEEMPEAAHDEVDDEPHS